MLPACQPGRRPPPATHPPTHLYDSVELQPICSWPKTGQMMAEIAAPAITHVGRATSPSLTLSVVSICTHPEGSSGKLHQTAGASSKAAPAP